MHPCPMRRAAAASAPTMPTSSSYSFNRGESDRVMSQGAVQWGNRVGRAVVNQAKKNAPVDEGRLRSSIAHTVAVRPGAVEVTVGSPLEYAAYQEEGTGIHGPRNALIYPTTMQALKFRASMKGPGQPAKGKRPWVFAKYVRGVEATHFLSRALETVLGPGNVRRRGR